MEDRNLFKCFLNLLRHATTPADCPMWHKQTNTHTHTQTNKQTHTHTHTQRQGYLSLTHNCSFARQQATLPQVSLLHQTVSSGLYFFAYTFRYVTEKPQDLHDGHSKVILGLFRSHSVPSGRRNEITNCYAFLLIYLSHHSSRLSYYMMMPVAVRSRRMYAAIWLLGLKFKSRWRHGCLFLVFIVCCVRRGLCDEPITRSMGLAQLNPFNIMKIEATRRFSKFLNLKNMHGFLIFPIWGACSGYFNFLVVFYSNEFLPYCNQHDGMTNTLLDLRLKTVSIDFSTWSTS
jgi:hypothetical protein